MFGLLIIDVSGPLATLKVGLTVDSNTLILNKRRYSSEIAVFDMFTVILRNTLKTTTSLMLLLGFTITMVKTIVFVSIIIRPPVTVVREDL